MNIETVKRELNNYIGKEVTIRCNLGRNKVEKYHAIIRELYNNIFLVELLNISNEIKTFSYSDVITKTIKIDY